MRPFAFARARSAHEAIAAVAPMRTARYIAGGTNLVDLMIDTVETPTLVVDINALPYREIAAHANFVRIGALARMSDVADHPLVKAQAPVVAQALEQSASAQLRNAASIGGNVMQRTRCTYFRDVSRACNKRHEGSGCAAIGGENRQHAILGTSAQCICTHPSDLAVALLATDALMRITGPHGERTVPIERFHRLPGDTPAVETVLAHGELITAVDLPSSRVAANSGYLKVRDRQSYAFALVSAAVGLDIVGGRIREARLGLGGVAPVPWRAHVAERALLGSAPTRANFEHAAELALGGAHGYGHNDFKIALAKRAIVRAFARVVA